AAHGSLTVVHGGGNQYLRVRGPMSAPGGSITRGDGLFWADDGFTVGQTVSVDGVGSYLVTAVVGATLTLSGFGAAATAVRTVAVLDPKTPGVARIGGDTILITGGGGPTSPLVVYGDTSQDGSWYSGSATDQDALDLGPKPFDQ